MLAGVCHCSVTLRLVMSVGRRFRGGDGGAEFKVNKIRIVVDFLIDKCTDRYKSVLL